MKLCELAQEYARSAALLRERIRSLEQAQRGTEDEQERLHLENRLRPLRCMYREVRVVERHLAGYYAHRENRGGDRA